MLIWRVRPLIRGRECDLRLLSLVDLEAAIDIIRVIGILPRAPKLPTRPIRVPRAGRTWRGVVGGVAEGSGALLTRNIGKINYLQNKAALDGRPSLYTNTNFCQFPESTCSSKFPKK